MEEKAKAPGLRWRNCKPIWRAIYAVAPRDIQIIEINNKKGRTPVPGCGQVFCRKSSDSGRNLEN